MKRRGFGRRVRHAARDRAREELAQVGRAAVDVAADVVRVVRLAARPGPSRCARGRASRKPGREALDLRLDRGSRHVDGRAVRHVAVGPQRVRAGGRAGRVEQALLGDEHERAAADAGRARPRASAAAISSSVPPRCTVPGPPALRRRPRHRPVERVVELEDARAVAVARRAPGGSARGSSSPAIARSWRGVRSKSTRARAAQLVERAHLAAGLDLAAERAQQRRHRVGDRLRAARRPPASRRRGRAAAASSPKRRGRRALERPHRVRGVAGEQRPRPLAREARAREAGRRAQRRRARSARPRAGGAAGAAGPSRSSTSASHVVARAAPSARGRPSASAPRPVGRLVDRAVQRDGAAVVERVRERDLGVRRTRARARASGSLRRNGEASASGWIAEHTSCRKPGQRQLRACACRRRSSPPPRAPHRAPRLRERDRRRQPVRARADDDRSQESATPVSEPLCGRPRCRRSRRRRCRQRAEIGS